MKKKVCYKESKGSKILLLAAGVFLLASSLPVSVHAGWFDVIAEKAAQSVQSIQQYTKGQLEKMKSTEIKVCFAGEKKDFANGTLSGFQQEHSKIKVNLYFDGSGKMMDDLNKSNTQGCDVVSPASTASALLYEDFDKGKVQYLFYSPTVLVTTKKKANAMKAFLSEDITLNNISKVANKRWSAIAPDSKLKGKNRGAFTDPSKSNSGLSVIMTRAYAYFDAFEPLSPDQLEDQGFQTAIQDFWKNIKHSATSTRKLTDAFSPSSARYSFIFTYEIMVPELADRFGKDLFVIYPEYAVMNDHPVWIVTSDPDKKMAAQAYIDYMLSPAVQEVATKKYAFRPANPEVKISLRLSASSWFNLEVGIVDLPKDSGHLDDIIKIANGDWEK